MDRLNSRRLIRSFDQAAMKRSTLPNYQSPFEHFAVNLPIGPTCLLIELTLILEYHSTIEHEGPQPCSPCGVGEPHCLPYFHPLSRSIEKSLIALLFCGNHSNLMPSESLVVLNQPFFCIDRWLDPRVWDRGRKLPQS